MKRPDILVVKSAEELKNWYWLKTELVCLAKSKGVSGADAKFEILDSIASHFEGKEIMGKPKNKVTSAFNWSKEPLSLETVITDSYKNTENVRSFFVEHCGAGFAFHIQFMNWMKSNPGKTLKNAIATWKAIRDLQKDGSSKTIIPKSNQYNQYVRDFFADNPDKTLKEAQLCWKLKRALSMERHVYANTDLTLISLDDKV